MGSQTCPECGCRVCPGERFAPYCREYCDALASNRLAEGGTWGAPRRGRPAAGPEPVNVSASLRVTESEDRAIDRITSARKRTGVRWSRSATIRELMLVGLAAADQ